MMLSIICLFIRSSAKAIINGYIVPTISITVSRLIYVCAIYGNCEYNDLSYLIGHVCVNLYSSHPLYGLVTL